MPASYKPGEFSVCQGDNQNPPGGNPVIPATSSCTTYSSTDLYIVCFSSLYACRRLANDISTGGSNRFCYVHRRSFSHRFYFWFYCHGNHDQVLWCHSCYDQVWIRAFHFDCERHCRCNARRCRCLVERLFFFVLMEWTRS
jgi:hypothetical protein